MQNESRMLGKRTGPLAFINFWNTYCSQLQSLKQSLWYNPCFIWSILMWNILIKMYTRNSYGVKSESSKNVTLADNAFLEIAFLANVKFWFYVYKSFKT